MFLSLLAFDLSRFKNIDILVLMENTISYDFFDNSSFMVHWRENWSDQKMNLEK